MRLLHRKQLILVATVAVALSGCRKKSTDATADDAAAAGNPPGASSSVPAGVDTRAAPKSGPRFAVKGLFSVINDEPGPRGKKIGYLRLGAVVERSDEPSGKADCPGGWYGVKPRGFACLDKDSTLDPEDPVIKAVPKVVDLTRPMPYAYGFVRAVLPLYLKVPNKQEQDASEFKLAEHLEWWAKDGLKANTPTVLFANDVNVDPMGVPHDEVKPTKNAMQMGQGELFGGSSDDDPIPWWLEGGRKIPNLAEFKVPDYAVFADRARRHTGLSFVGSFPTGEDSYNRRFAITWDMRLAPTSKVKPDGGSAFHGVAIGDTVKVPFAFVHDDGAKQYKIDGEKVRAYKKQLSVRAIVPLTGNKKTVDRRLYLETEDGKWVRAAQVNAVLPPEPMPPQAKKGEKWIDISITEQTLVLWEGSTPVYATVVSTGQDRLGDPKTTKSTVRGTFRVQSKHVTTTMDSNEGMGGGKVRDAEYGKTRRRGEGTFQLQDVPWVQYFKGNYALHGAYWHDVFGTPRSHGCVNLSPIDAHRVFFWTEPNLAQGWHGVYAKGEEGTVVIVRE
ncbi:MAG TPA: L,D-transpeptidase [Polyangiaceae bacterium]|nr:L,D-transpeptidase [Polyangiaceae bacterium]